jgi:hypothetical protein
MVKGIRPAGKSAPVGWAFQPDSIADSTVLYGKRANTFAGNDAQWVWPWAMSDVYNRIASGWKA